MSSEPEFQAHKACFQCGEVRYIGDMKEVDDIHLCSDGDCYKKYKSSTNPGAKK